MLEGVRKREEEEREWREEVSGEVEGLKEGLPKVSSTSFLFSPEVFADFDRGRSADARVPHQPAQVFPRYSPVRTHLPQAPSQHSHALHLPSARIQRQLSYRRKRPQVSLRFRGLVGRNADPPQLAARSHERQQAGRRCQARLVMSRTVGRTGEAAFTSQ